MNYSIRPFRSSEYNKIANWWIVQNECPPIDGMMIEDGTFILELNNIPALSLTVLLTQSKELAYIEGFIKNPELKDFNLEPFGKALWEHCFQYAKDKGYTRVITYCLVDKLNEKYARFGMRITAKNLTSLAREI